MNRRDLIAFAGGALASGAAWSPLSAAPAEDFKPGLRLYDVRAFGPAGKWTALDSKSINAAVDACHAAGGGVVYTPPGVYRSGTVVLKSNVTLYLEAGATILGSKDIGDYSHMPGPPEKGDANQKHLIFARDA